MEQPKIPTNAAVKKWTKDLVRRVKEGDAKAKKMLREHLRDCGHRGGLAMLKFPN